MMPSRKNSTTQYKTNISDVLINEGVINRMTFVITPDATYFLDKGEVLETEKVKSLYPTTLERLDWNVNDPDSRKIA